MIPMSQLCIPEIILNQPTRFWSHRIGHRNPHPMRRLSNRSVKIDQIIWNIRSVDRNPVNWLSENYPTVYRVKQEPEREVKQSLSFYHTCQFITKSRERQEWYPSLRRWRWGAQPVLWLRSVCSRWVNILRPQLPLKKARNKFFWSRYLLLTGSFLEYLPQSGCASYGFLALSDHIKTVVGCTNREHWGY